MRSYQTHECPVYPGEYVPRQGMERRMAILRSGRKKIETTLQVNIKELPEAFRMEIALPGVDRDEILLFVHDGMLIIDVLHDRENERPGISQLQEFDMSGKERQIELPENADTEFVSAEYRKGLLNLFIPKAEKKVASGKKQIIVY